MKNSLQIKNAVAVLSKFDRSIKLNLVRFGPKKFGHVCEQTGKKLCFESSTRLNAAVLVASRYGTHQSYADGAYVNPKCLAKSAGLTMAFDFLIACGFVTAKNRVAEIVQSHDMAKNQ